MSTAELEGEGEDVVVQLVVDSSPNQRRIRCGHVAEGSVIHNPCRCSELPAKLANLVLVGNKIRGKDREVVNDSSQVNIPGLQPRVKCINSAFALL